MRVQIFCKANYAECVNLNTQIYQLEYNKRHHKYIIYTKHKAQIISGNA